MSTRASTKESKKVQRKYNKIATDVKSTAVRLIHIRLPQKVIEMHKIVSSLPLCDLESTRLVAGKIDEAKAVSDPVAAQGLKGPHVGKKRKLSKDESSGSGSESSAVGPDRLQAHVPCNLEVVKLMENVKKEINELIETVGVIKVYIQLNIPKMEDGNNFGVEVQEETVGEINKVEDIAFSALESNSKYFVMRGKCVSKILKYPEIKDYVQSVRELDGKQFVKLKMTCVDVRDSYMLLYDIITKNEDKIKKPREVYSEASMLY
mmetsp:Transcript_4517/g.8623  ORF Transcript_4517/g.8623 Transcript_4517/m.8623 type:complete len:263 (+) Transcript_4517:22-810(+)